MFDIGGLELLVIAVVLIVVVGPKDLPKMLRTFGRLSGQARRMAGDFRKQFDEALKEAELDELKDVAEDVRALDPRSDIRKAMNPIRAVGDEIRSSLKAASVAPESKVPSADAPATPMESPKPVEADPLKPMASNPNGPASEPVNAEPAGPPAKPVHINGSGTPASDVPVRDPAGGVS